MGKRRVLLIGLDGLVPGMVEQFRRDTPHTDRLMREGVFARALPCMPTDTPTNWTTIATGADTLRHGVAGFARGPDGRILPYFDGNRCKAEFIWESLERAGRKAVLVNYPTAWPLRTEATTVVGGDGIFSPNWRIGDLILYSTEAGGERRTSVALMDVCKTDVRIELREASGWRGLPQSARPPLEARVPSIERTAASWSGDGFVVNTEAEAPVSGHYELLVTASNGDGYDTVRVCRDKDAGGALCVLRQGEWSDWIFQDFDTPDGRAGGSFKFKLIELSGDGHCLRLYRTMADRTDGWTQPAGLARELVEKIGPYHEGWENSPMQLAAELGVGTLLEHAAGQAEWLAGAAAHLAARGDWDLLMVQAHVQDSYNHRFMWKLEPLCADYDADAVDEALDLFRRVHVITDEMVGRIVRDCADEATTVIVLSDHGCMPIHTAVCVEGILDGCVDADDALAALAAARDPRTGDNPFAILARREDLPSLGLAAEGGEVAHFLKGGYRGMPLPEDEDERAKMLAEKAFFQPCTGATHHGLPTGAVGRYENAGTFLAAGAGVAEGRELPHPVHLKDVTPTICHLLGVAPPRHSEGRILWEALAAP